MKAPIITAEEIRTIQDVEDWRNRYVIVDVRGKAESDVSVIPGAITKAEFEETIQQHQGKTVIAYCTVGFRSGIYAKKLGKKGWRSYNYKGSILDWCKNQLPVVTTDGEETNRVHTYNSWYSVGEGYVAVHKRSSS